MSIHMSVRWESHSWLSGLGPRIYEGQPRVAVLRGGHFVSDSLILSAKMR